MGSPLAKISSLQATVSSVVFGKADMLSKWYTPSPARYSFAFLEHSINLKQSCDLGAIGALVNKNTSAIDLTSKKHHTIEVLDLLEELIAIQNFHQFY